MLQHAPSKLLPHAKISRQHCRAEHGKHLLQKPITHKTSDTHAPGLILHLHQAVPTPVRTATTQTSSRRPVIVASDGPQPPASPHCRHHAIDSSIDGAITEPSFWTAGDDLDKLLVVTFAPVEEKGPTDPNLTTSLIVIRRTRWITLRMFMSL